MGERKIQISLEQLQDIVSDAVNNALKNIDHLQVVEDGNAPEEIAVGKFTDAQYEEAMRVMAANRGKGEEPKVGIFWYNATLGQLFGVVSHKTSDYVKPNAGGGLITCSEMHEDVWKKEYRKQKYQNNNIGPYKGEYQNKPRGRVFYSPTDDKYIIAVGSWINEHKDAVELIMNEFDLPKENSVIQVASHWDIGQTWQ